MSHDSDANGIYVDPGQPLPAPDMVDAAYLVGLAVVTPDCTQLGDIKDIVIDMRSCQISYAVVSSGGMFNKKLHAVPWNELTFDGVHQRFMLAMSKDEYDNSGDIDMAHWSDVEAKRQVGQIPDYYRRVLQRS